MYRNYLKPFFDLFFSFVGLLILSPVFILVMVCLYIVNDGKPFFYQLRPGKDEKIFKIIKFKTMNDKTDAEGNLLKDTERLTTIGKIVRKTSLDEIPQLINVLKGDMSIIGPRPLLPEYLPLYTQVQKRRHLVKPGITGLAQVKGRNQLKFSERLINDVYYEDNLNFFLDFKILLLTIRSVLFKSSSVVIGQTVDDIDDIGLSKNLSSNHFKKKQDEYKR